MSFTPLTSSFHPTDPTEDPICRYTATTLFGLEPLLAAELERLGAQSIEQVRRAVLFSGNRALLYEANYTLRTALRILKPFLCFRASDPDDLYHQLVKYPWERFLLPNGSFFIDTAIYSEHFSNSRYALYRLKDAIVDHETEITGARTWQFGKNRHADLCLHLHISGNEVTLSLDSSGESLHHRGWRDRYTEAPLNEVLAAGILLKAGYDGQRPLIDPMCGSGTLLIEAAMIAAGVPPGSYRREFAFMKWGDFDKELFDQIKERYKYRKQIRYTITGSDKSFAAIGVAGGNVARAGFRNDIHLNQIDVRNLPAPRQPSLIVTNPPYGVRLGGDDDLSQLYSELGSLFKHRYAGSEIWLIASGQELFHAIGLRPDHREKLFNGDLECELRCYRIFAGKRSDLSSDPHTEDTPQREERVPRSSRKDSEGYRDRGERKPFRKEGEGYRDRGERKPFRKEGEGYRDRGERKPFRKEGEGYRDRGYRKPFRKEGEGFRDRGERKPFRKEGEGYRDRGERKPFRDGDDRFRSSSERPPKKSRIQVFGPDDDE